MTSSAHADVRYARLPSGAALAYESTGEGVDVVKMPSSLPSPPWSPLARIIREAVPGARVTVYGHVGSGMSDRDGYDFSLGGLVTELEAVISESVPGQFVLVAQSATAPAAITYAASHPDRVIALVLYRSWLRGTEYVGTETFETYRRSLEGDWRVGSETWAALAQGLSGEDRREGAAGARELVEQATYLEYLDALAGHDASSVAEGVTVSTYVVGTDSRHPRPCEHEPRRRTCHSRRSSRTD